MYWYRYRVPRIYFGTGVGNFSWSNKFLTEGSPCNNLNAKLTNHGLSWYVPKLANHICQSKRFWCGTMKVGAAETFPGLWRNWYSTHGPKWDKCWHTHIVISVSPKRIDYKNLWRDFLFLLILPARSFECSRMSSGLPPSVPGKV